MEKEISVIGVPSDLGQARRGVDMGPSAIRYAGLIEKLEELQYVVHELGNIPIKRPDRHEKMRADHLKNLDEVVAANTLLANTVNKEKTKKRFPLILGGDHSIAIGTLAGMANHYENLGVIWFDAHGDINTPETSPSGNIHGMPLAVSLGLGHEKLTSILNEGPKIKSENIVIIGARDLDDGEKTLLKELEVKVYTMHEIDRLGMSAVMDEAIDYLKDRTDGLHLSFDLDGITPEEAPGVGTPVFGGVTYREAHLALEMLAETNLITSAEFVEVNPMLDDKNKTAILTVALIGSLLGEKLL